MRPEQVRATALGSLTASGPAEARTAQLMTGLGHELALADCRLYVRDGSASAYRLAQTWTSDTSGSRPPVPTAEADRHEAQLELTAGPSAPLETVLTQSGPLHALRLEVPGSLDALLLVRDARGGLSRGARRALVAGTDVLAAVVAELRREGELERDLATTTARAETSRRLHGSAVELDQFLRLLIELAVSATHSEAGFVAVAGPRGDLAVRARVGLSDEVEIDLTAQSGMFDWELAQADAPLLLRDPAQAAALGFRSVLALPLQERGVPLGVFGLVTMSRPAAFGEQSLQLLSSFADQITLMLDNQRVFAEFTERYLVVLEGIAAAVDARRPGTAGYSRTVARVAAAVSERMALAPQDQEALRRAGLLHDIGLAALPGARDHYAVDLEHPAVGAGLLETVPVSPVLVSAVQCHHEWYDGWGFPHGLRGDQIPPGGRILALAAFAGDMRTGDPARAAWSVERVIEEVRTRAGSQFDPLVVEASVPLLPDVLT